ncbi:asparagine synthase [Streptomyces sp. 130]|uniref:albusnodin/ikarugamycin family macrolactam cyclase n=1 Tax=Streptomyces sp. 130 TaxID=2591006 RepID=UPI00117D8423|nr:albusnodin/ikarugamycin family macrolactam cyclase [Streptomyces sp. 130]TRV75610.1 asparagine synthase [Streptomyces sp. 130]
MRWYGGSAPGGPARAPEGARLLRHDPPLWTVGTWPERLVRTAEVSGVRLTVFGPCSAETTALSRVVEASDLARATAGWAGSFTVVRQGPGGETEVIADAVGACPVYVARTAEGVVWGSSSLALAEVAGRDVDAEWLRSYLADRQTPLPGRSAWCGVEPVPPGHRLVLRPDGSVTMPSWWSQSQRSYGEAVPLVAKALGDGVRARVEAAGPVSADLAGMDSTSVAVLAARDAQVLGLTAHPEGVTSGGDMRYARALDVPNLERIEFPLHREYLPFTPAPGTALPTTDEPFPSSVLWSQFSAELLTVAGRGSVVHLTGDGGDNVFMAPPTHLADLVRRGRLLRMGRDLLAWSQLRRTSPWPLARAALARDVPGPYRPWMAWPAWLRGTVGPGLEPPADADGALIADVRAAARMAHADVQAAGALGVQLENPYFDAALLDAVVSVPARDRFTVHRYKPLLVDAMYGTLPEKHRARATKGVFAGDFHRGARLNKNILLPMADGRLAELGLVEPRPLRTALHAVTAGVESVWPPILAALVAEMWLEAIERHKSARWVPVAAVAR